MKNPVWVWNTLCHSRGDECSPLGAVALSHGATSIVKRSDATGARIVVQFLREWADALEQEVGLASPVPVLNKKELEQDVTLEYLTLRDRVLNAPRITYTGLSEAETYPRTLPPGIYALVQLTQEEMIVCGVGGYQALPRTSHLGAES